jgi:alpha-beta hydrolase superfamily lysophospholipase
MKLGIRLLFLFTVVSMAFLQSQVRGDDTSLYRIEEITIPAGEFTVVGDLYVPVAGDKHPLVVWVHGSGPLTRQIMVPLIKPEIEVFLKAGFAFFIDDIPGAGSSTGTIKKVYRDRAMILCKEVEALKGRPDIIPQQIGIAGHSQAGIVMPTALQNSRDIAFMIATACVAENSVEQESYLLEKFMTCEGYPIEEAQKARQLNRQRFYAENYKDYREAGEYINNHPAAQTLEITWPMVEEAAFKPRSKAATVFIDPMPIIAQTTIPVLAMFGEKDCNVNSVQGVEAYNKALQAAGNQFYHVAMIPNANHMLYATDTGCARDLMGQIQKGVPDFAPETLTVLADWLEKLKAHFGK